MLAQNLVYKQNNHQLTIFPPRLDCTVEWKFGQIPQVLIFFSNLQEKALSWHNCTWEKPKPTLTSPRIGAEHLSKRISCQIGALQYWQRNGKTSVACGAATRYVLTSTRGILYIICKYFHTFEILASARKRIDIPPRPCMSAVSPEKMINLTFYDLPHESFTVVNIKWVQKAAHT